MRSQGVRYPNQDQVDQHRNLKRTLLELIPETQRLITAVLYLGAVLWNTTSRYVYYTDNFMEFYVKVGKDDFFQQLNLSFINVNESYYCRIIILLPNISVFLNF